MPQRDLKILVVDDNPSDRLVLVAMLKNFKICSIQEAEDGSVAEYKLNNAHEMKAMFDVVFVDWQMPKADGLKLLQLLKNDPRFRGVGVIMVTANAAEERVVAAIKNQADDFIVKPIEAEILQKRLESFLKKVGKQ